MNAVHPGKGIQIVAHEMDYVHQTRGVQVRDLVTKYFYQNNQLSFQIILQLESGERVLYGEFLDYGSYKESMTALKKAKATGSIIKIQKND